VFVAADVRSDRLWALEADAMNTANEFALELEGITRSFGDFVAVDRLTLCVPKGRL